MDTKSTETEINWGTYEQSRPENPHASEWVRMTPFEFVIPNFDRILDLKLGPKYIDYFNFCHSHGPLRVKAPRGDFCPVEAYVTVEANTYGVTFKAGIDDEDLDEKVKGKIDPYLSFELQAGRLRLQRTKRSRFFHHMLPWEVVELTRGKLLNRDKGLTVQGHIGVSTFTQSEISYLQYSCQTNCS